MKVLMTFLNWLVGGKEAGIYNIPLLICVITLLLIALGISIMISKKNRLYIRSAKKEKTIHIFRRNEAA